MNNQDQLPEEEIVNPEQFHVGPNPEERESQTKQDDQAGYTPGETEFADGEGTRLVQQSEELEIDPQAHDLDDTDGDPQSDDEDADFENPKDDPA